MRTHPVLAALPMFAVAGILLLLGARIRAGDLHLIAGYDPSRVSDKAGLGQRFGRVVAGLGWVGLAAGIVLAIWPAWGFRAIFAFGVAGVVATVVLLMIGRRYDVATAGPPDHSK